MNVAVGQEPADSPLLDSLILSMNSIRKMEAKRGTLCVLPQLLSPQYGLVTTGKCDSSRSASGTPRRKRETESRTSKRRWSLITQAAIMKRNTGHLESHVQHPRKENIPASQRENRGSEQWRVSPKSDWCHQHLTQVYTSGQDSYSTHYMPSLTPKGQMPISEEELNKSQNSRCDGQIWSMKLIFQTCPNLPLLNLKMPHNKEPSFCQAYILSSIYTLKYIPGVRIPQSAVVLRYQPKVWNVMPSLTVSCPSCIHGQIVKNISDNPQIFSTGEPILSHLHKITTLASLENDFNIYRMRRSDSDTYGHSVKVKDSTV